MNKTKQDVRDRIAEFEKFHPATKATGIRSCEADAYAKARDAMKALIDATNVMGCDQAVQAGIVQALRTSHRYLTGQGITAILTALGEYGAIPGESDGRNEFAKETCKLLRERIGDRIYWKD